MLSIILFSPHHNVPILKVRMLKLEGVNQLAHAQVPHKLWTSTLSPGLLPSPHFTSTDCLLTERSEGKILSRILTYQVGW